MPPEGRTGYLLPPKTVNGSEFAGFGTLCPVVEGITRVVGGVGVGRDPIPLDEGFVLGAVDGALDATATALVLGAGTMGWSEVAAASVVSGFGSAAPAVLAIDVGGAGGRSTRNSVSAAAAATSTPIPTPQ